MKTLGRRSWGEKAEACLLDSIGYFGGRKMADMKTGIVLLRPGRVMIGEGQWERSLDLRNQSSWSHWVIIRQCLQALGHTREQETEI